MIIHLGQQLPPARNSSASRKAIIMRAANIMPPFSEAHELNSELTGRTPDSNPNLPGYPQIPLQDTQELQSFLKEDLLAPTLERLAPYLWWMSKQSSAHIAPLHHQTIKFREVVLTENPELHLIWYYDRVFIKPLPKYLLSHAFWTNYIMITGDPSFDCKSIERSALGFLRTYRHLIKYESDFNIAKEKSLIPTTVTWEKFSNFVCDLKAIEDTHVSGRYLYGEIRLTRLNFYIKFLLGRSTFHKIHGQYQSYFSRFYGPLFFLFGMVSVLLTALQVELAAEPLLTNQWPDFGIFSRWLGVILTASVLTLLLILCSVLVIKIATEWYFAFRDRNRRLHRNSFEIA